MNQQKICEIIKTLLPEPGIKRNIADRIDLFHMEESSDRSPFIYSQSIVIIMQGKKRVYIGSSTITYDPLNYLVLSVPLPVDCDVVASREEPVLGITIHVDAAMINELMITANMLSAPQKTLSPGIYSDKMNSQMFEAIYRLAHSLLSPEEQKVLTPMYVKEIIYRVLTSENGAALRMLAYRNQAFFKIEQILGKIHRDYDQKFDINALAEEADMSISAFHSAFKKITDFSPLQYIKKVKLHKARELILDNGINASSAAFQVGYESPSQFTREYKRMFGTTPGRKAV